MAAKKKAQKKTQKKTASKGGQSHQGGNRSENKQMSGKSTVGIQPLGDRVIIKEKADAGAERVTDSGIIIPVTVDSDKGSKRGEVVAVGPGRYDDGVQIPVGVNIGDTVLFSWGDTVKIEGQEYFIVRESEIIAVLNK